MIKETTVGDSKFFFEMRNVIAGKETSEKQTAITFIGGAVMLIDVPYQEVLQHAKEHNQNQFGENLDRPKPIPDIELDAVNIDRMSFQLTIRRYNDTTLRTTQSLILRTNFDITNAVKTAIAKVCEV